MADRFNADFSTVLSTIKGCKTPATVTASIRWWDSDRTPNHVNGKVSLQSNIADNMMVPEYRLAYEGHLAGNPQTRAFGAIYLPSEVAWNVETPKGQSDNAMARFVQLVFLEQEPNSVQLSRVQITIPFTGDGKVEKLFAKAVFAADQACREATKILDDI